MDKSTAASQICDSNGGHHHHHGQDLGELNRQVWDKHAHEYEAHEWQQKLCVYVRSQLDRHRALLGIDESVKAGSEKQPFRLLDYACGTGNVTRALMPFITQAVGFDVSPNMVATYNKHAADNGIPAEEMHAVAGNMLSSPAYLLTDAQANTKLTSDGASGFLSEAEWSGFDACVVGLGFHHFEDYAACLAKFAERCRSGGRVGIVDCLPRADFRDQVPEELRRSMHVSGFTEEQMRGYMAEAGLKNMQYVELEERVYMEMKGNGIWRTLFLAVGTKA